MERLDREPFQPFIVELLDGKQVEIDRPRKLAIRGGTAGGFGRGGKIVMLDCDKVSQVFDVPLASKELPERADRRCLKRALKLSCKNSYLGDHSRCSPLNCMAGIVLKLTIGERWSKRMELQPSSCRETYACGSGMTRLLSLSKRGRISPYSSTALFRSESNRPWSALKTERLKAQDKFVAAGGRLGDAVELLFQSSCRCLP